MNKRVKKKLNNLSIYGRDKKKSNALLKLYVKPEKWSRRVWVFVSSRYKGYFHHYGASREDAIELALNGHFLTDEDLDEREGDYDNGYLITDRNMLVLAVYKDFDRKLDIVKDSRKRICYLRGHYCDRTISLVSKGAIDGYVEDINDSVYIYKYLFKTHIKKYLAPAREYITLSTGETILLRKEFPHLCENFSIEQYEILEKDYIPKNTKSIYMVYMKYQEEL